MPVPSDARDRQAVRGITEDRLPLDQGATRGPVGDLDRALDDQHDPPAAGPRDGDPVGAGDDPPQRELRRRRAVAPDPGGLLVHLHQLRHTRGEVQDGQQLRHVDVLGGEAAPHHVVGVGHDLHADPVQVGVQVAGRQEQTLEPTEAHPVHQQRGQHPRIAGIVLVQLDRRLGEEAEVGVHGARVRLDQLGRRGDDLGHHLALALGEPEHPGEDLGQRLGPTALQRRDELGRRRDPEPREERVRLVRLPEPAQCLDVAESHQHLGLRPVVTVEARRRPPVDPGLLLAREPGLRPGPRGVGLERERLGRGQHLQQVRQLRPELPHRRLTDHPVGIGGDQVGQGPVTHPGRCRVVGAEPQLGLWTSVGFDAEERGQRGRRAPRIVLHRTGQAIHRVRSFRSEGARLRSRAAALRRSGAPTERRGAPAR